jgi:nitric oxide reductase NorD protein
LLTSIALDWGEIPPEMLVAAGDGEYDAARYEVKEKDPNEVWQGTYHLEGAHLYPEWDFARQHYRKNWCVLREIDLEPGDPAYVAEVIAKHQGLVKHLRRTFEAMRDESKLLKRQPQGEDVDIDALVEAHADQCAGLEMTDRLFIRQSRDDRNIAVCFMVDMSGSTKGWINLAEREALILLAEALETLGDRFAIYGFSGWTRNRCEVFAVKRFDEPYDAAARGRIGGIEAHDYTRMGAPIRHLCKLLAEQEARTRILITLSDGKPDDYDPQYRGQYGIEDTRQALFEARLAGIHPFCITIDREGKAYLPHMYGHANWVEIDEVRKLPLKVADIYRRLTS